MGIDNKSLFDDIKNYYISPGRMTKEKTGNVKGTIDEIDAALFGNPSLVCLQDFFEYLKKNCRLEELIRQQRADEQGLAATRNYGEFYFNEIIQNANDNTDGEDIAICFGKDKEENGSERYSISFTYADNGFRTENLIGFFNSEIHTKGKNLSTTGKHGVGIKSLFYFVDKMVIDSNVHIEISISASIEDGIEKIDAIPIDIIKNQSSGNSTKLTIYFTKKNDDGNQIQFNTGKLTDFIDLLYSDDVRIHGSLLGEIKKCFWNGKKKELIFDCRSLLFTDKNRGKTKGIKKMEFSVKQASEPIFSIDVQKSNVCDLIKDSDAIYGEDPKYTVGRETISLKVNDKEEPEILDKFLTVKKESSKSDEQNFTVAFPEKIKCGRGFSRYYETYYIPDSEDSRKNYNILINSKYSSPDRTKLTDKNVEEKEIILEKIDEELDSVYVFLFGASCKDLTNEIRLFISNVFHSMLVKNMIDEENNLSFLSICIKYGISNRYLLKFKNEEQQKKYLVYCRKEKEEYEKRLINQEISPESILNFINQEILSDDTLKYDKDSLIEGSVSEAYDLASKEGESLELRRILNYAGDIRNLIYYRVKGEFCIEGNPTLSDSEVDDWTDKLCDKGRIGLTLIGRYKLHPHVSPSGDINKGSFYTFLFADASKSSLVTASTTSVCKFRDKANEEFSKLSEVRDKLRQNMLRDEKGNTDISFWASWDTRARCDTDIVSSGLYFEDSLENNLSKEEIERLIENIAQETDLLKHLKRIIIKENLYLVLADSRYPSWGNITFSSGVKRLATAQKGSACFMKFDFVRKLEADSWDRFRGYYDFYDKNREVLKCGIYRFSLSTVEPGMPFEIDDLQELFYFVYKDNKRYLENLENNVFGTNMVLSIGNIPGEIKNLCPNDYCAFLKNMTGKDIIVWETPETDAKKTEIIFAFNRKIKAWNGDFWQEIAGVKESFSDSEKLFILHNGKTNYRDAIKKVLTEIIKNEDILNKLDSFLICNNSSQLLGDKYDNFTGRDVNPVRRSRSFDTKIKAKDFTCSQLKKLLLSRGIQDGKCACCGNITEFENAELIISNNEEDFTKEGFPQLYEVVCRECKDLLRSCLKKARLTVDEKRIVYVCEINNQHQIKKVEWSHSISDGKRYLCKI